MVLRTADQPSLRSTHREANMFGHVILGLLRDCRLRHGYEIMTECRARSGSPVSIGNIYRELARLAGQGLVQTAINPPDADARRIPYHITEKGRLAFDQWLQAPSSQDDVAHWLLFVDRVPAEIRVRLLDRWQEELWMRGKELARAREDALAKRGRQPPEHYNPLAPLLSRRMKQVAAELEFLKEFRLEFESWLSAQQRPVEQPSVAESRRPAPRREKGPPRK